MRHTAWKKITEERYDEMLGVVPPATMRGVGFLVGEPYSHRHCTMSGQIRPTYMAFAHVGADFFECDEPLTHAEYIWVSPADVRP